MKGNFDKLIDLFMFRMGTEEDEEGAQQPVITTGSIIWGMILRTAIIVVISFFVVSRYPSSNAVWMLLFALWLIAIYPGWQQFQNFKRKMDKFEEETLCGSCRHFDSSSQLCTIYDEHPTKDYIPCEGLNWEPSQFDSK